MMIEARAWPVRSKSPRARSVLRQWVVNPNQHRAGVNVDLREASRIDGVLRWRSVERGHRSAARRPFGFLINAIMLARAKQFDRRTAIEMRVW